MADRSAIEWTDSTFNPWTGCTKVSPGCDHCYAESWSARAGAKVGKWGPGAPRVRTSAANWRLPVKWNNTRFLECSACGWRGESCEAIYLSMPPELYDDSLNNNDRDVCPRCRCEVLAATRRRVFCASLADVFDNEVPAEWRADLFRLIASTPNLDWLVLTKRIGNADRMLRTVMDNLNREGVESPYWPWPNVWLGATIVDQAEADRDIPKLLATSARVRFLSMEPLLGRVDLSAHLESRDAPGPDGTFSDRYGFNGRLHWVIVGGESGQHARPMHPDWARSLRDQCATAGVPFLFKQWGEWAPYDRGATDGAILATPFSLDDPVQKFGKKLAGRLLDGRTHDEFPDGVRVAAPSVPPSEKT